MKIPHDFRYFFAVEFRNVLNDDTYVSAYIMIMTEDITNETGEMNDRINIVGRWNL